VLRARGLGGARAHAAGGNRGPARRRPGARPDRPVLRYVVRVRDGVELNVALVRAGIAAPYFFDGDRGRYATLLTRLALRARARHLGLWGACPRTPVDFERGVDTGPAG
jgi:endonuclease YncB( thermonuclease family)